MHAGVGVISLMNRIKKLNFKKSPVQVTNPLLLLVHQGFPAVIAMFLSSNYR